MTLSIPQFDAIPHEMRQFSNWVLWRSEERDGKLTKIPYDPKVTFRKAKADDPKTWGTFEQAKRAFKKGNFSGIGFQFSNTPFFGVDTDHKKFDGEIHPIAHELLEALDTYSEFSPSKKGQHAIGRGKLPEWALHKKQLAPDLEIEVYDTGRFFTITGDLIFSGEIEERQEALEALLKRYGLEKAQPEPRATFTGLTASYSGSDSELWERIFASSSGATVKALADGDLSQHGGDHSRADFAMCSHLAFWCNGDAHRIDSMFRTTGLYRPKWDTRHSSDGSTYGEMTINQVLNRWDGRGYEPGRKRETVTVDASWTDPMTLLKGRQHLASSGSHGASVNSYSKLWQALIHVITQGWYTQEGETLTLTSYGMTELYAHAGGRPMDRRQQLQFLQAQGMVGKLVRQDPEDFRSAWLLTMPSTPSALPFWQAKEALCPLPVNSLTIQGGPKLQKKPTPPYCDNYCERESPKVLFSLSAKVQHLPFWTLFSLSVLGVGTTAELADLVGVGERQIRRHLVSLTVLVKNSGRQWKSRLTPQEVGQLYLHITADEVEKRRRSILEDRLEFHENKFRYLVANGFNKQAAPHFHYAERYRRILEAA